MLVVLSLLSLLSLNIGRCKNLNQKYESNFIYKFTDKNLKLINKLLEMKVIRICRGFFRAVVDTSEHFISGSIKVQRNLKVEWPVCSELGQIYKIWHLCWYLWCPINGICKKYITQILKAASIVDTRKKQHIKQSRFLLFVPMCLYVYLDVLKLHNRL